MINILMITTSSPIKNNLTNNLTDILVKLIWNDPIGPLLILPVDGVPLTEISLLLRSCSLLQLGQLWLGQSHVVYDDHLVVLSLLLHTLLIVIRLSQVSINTRCQIIILNFFLRGGGAIRTIFVLFAAINILSALIIVIITS